MKYYRLQSHSPNQSDESREGALNIPQQAYDRWPLLDGKTAESWNPQLCLVAREHGPLVDFPYVLGTWHVGSQQFGKLLCCLAPRSIELLPIRIRTVIGDFFKDQFFVFNYLSLVDALSREESDVCGGDWSQDEFGEFENLELAVLSRRRIADHRVFRVLGHAEWVVYREDVVDAVQETKLTGCEFIAAPCGE